MSNKFKAPKQAIDAARTIYKHEDYSWFFNSDFRAWCPGPKPSSARYVEKGLRGVRTGNKAFRKMNDAIAYTKDI